MKAPLKQIFYIDATDIPACATSWGCGGIWYTLQF